MRDDHPAGRQVFRWKAVAQLPLTILAAVPHVCFASPVDM
jgi:hypothetical protein